MPAALPYQSNCCTSCDDPNVQSVPGATGSPGNNGEDGADGADAYTTTSTNFTTPAAGGTVSITVGTTAWMAVGQPLFIQGAGFYQVDTITNTTTVTVQNLEDGTGIYAGNTDPSIVISSGAKVTPGGWQGPTSAITYSAAGDIELDGSSNPRLQITSTKGDLVVNNNNASAPRNTRLAVGADGTSLRANSATATGLEWSKTDLSDTNDVTGAVNIANGGTGQTAKTAAFDALSPTTTRGDLVRMGASNNERFAPSATGQVPQYNGTDTTFALISSSNLDTQMKRATVDVIVLKDDAKSSGTGGGTATSGGWATRDLTTEVIDTGSDCSLAANQFTLQAGTYRLRASAPAYQVDNHQIRLYDVTNTTVVSNGYGTNARAAAAGAEMTHSFLDVRFTVGTATTYRIEHRVETTRATSGFGVGNSFGGNEVYTVVTLEKEAG